MYNNILIVKPSSLGDIANAMVIIPQLRLQFSKAKIDWLANSEYASLVALAQIDDVMIFDRSVWRKKWGFFNGIKSFVKLSLALRKKRYDLVIDLQGLLRSGWFSWFSGANVRVGFADAREGATLFYNRKIVVDRHSTHAVDCYLAALQNVCQISTPAWQWPALAELVLPLNIKKNNYFVFVAGARWKTKQWPLDSFAELALLLWHHYKLPIYISGSPDEATLAENLVQKVKLKADVIIESLAGKMNIPQLAALCRDSLLVVAGDTGPLHLADAVGAKCLAIMGATNPVKHGPYQQMQNLLFLNMACSPCHKRSCKLRVVPCMSDIVPKMAFDKIIEILKSVLADSENIL